jgi:hypothetical protein
VRLPGLAPAGEVLSCCAARKKLPFARQLVNYVSEFQAHSTNDFKMRAFAAFLAELAPNAALDLYFSATESYKEAEQHAIRKYDPLLNKLPPPSAEAREALKSAFEFYYRSSFELRLSK